MNLTCNFQAISMDNHHASIPSFHQYSNTPSIFHDISIINTTIFLQKTLWFNWMSYHKNSISCLTIFNYAISMWRFHVHTTLVQRLPLSPRGPDRGPDRGLSALLAPSLAGRSSVDRRCRWDLEGWIRPYTGLGWVNTIWLVVSCHPSEKYESIGMISNPIYGKINLMFQTTNQP